MRRELAGILCVVVALAACSKNNSSGASSSPKGSLAEVFHLVAENSPSSLEDAIAATEPGSAAAKYLSAWLLNLRAYVDIGGGGAVLRPIPLEGGGVGFCSLDRGKPICAEYQHPSFGADERLAGFTVNGVDVARLVRLGGDAPAQRLPIAPGVYAQVIALRRRPADGLNVVLRVRNDTETPASLPNPTDFGYRRDGLRAAVPSTSYAMPPTVAARSSGLLTFGFHDADFGGTLVLAGPGGSHEVHIPGPPVVLPNRATERI